MKRMIVFLLLVLLLASCSPSNVTPTFVPTEASAVPATIEPTVTSTSVPTVQVDGISVPDPRITHPELFDISKPESPIPQFVGAMNLVGIDINNQQILDAMKDPSNFKTKQTVKGENYVEISYRTTDKKGTDYSIRFIYDVEAGWRLFTFKDAEKIDGIEMKTNLSSRSEVIDYGQAVVAQLNALVLRNYSGVINADLDWTFFNDGYYKQDLQVTEANHMTTSGEDLLYPYQNFRYVPELRDFKAQAERGGLSPEEMKQKLIQLIVDHIRTEVMATRGRVEQWSVVNEHNQTDDQYYQIIGDDYIDIAFQTARNADPSARLFYLNDGNEIRSGPNYQQDLAVVRKLKDKGLIDAIGLQMHIMADRPPTKQELIATMQSYGMPVIVAGLDINMKNISGTPEARNQLQAQIGREVIEACREAGVCHDINFWTGWGDKYSWLYSDTPNGDKYGPNVDPTPFTSDGLYKPVFWSMIDALDQNK